MKYRHITFNEIMNNRFVIIAIVVTMLSAMALFYLNTHQSLGDKFTMNSKTLGFLKTIVNIILIVLPILLFFMSKESIWRKVVANRKSFTTSRSIGELMIITPRGLSYVMRDLSDAEKIIRLIFLFPRKEYRNYKLDCFDKKGLNGYVIDRIDFRLGKVNVKKIFIPEDIEKNMNDTKANGFLVSVNNKIVMSHNRVRLGTCLVADKVVRTISTEEINKKDLLKSFTIPAR